MYLERRFMVEAATLGGKESQNDLMGNVIIQRISGRQGVAIASDRYILAVVPVTLEDSDTCGPIPADFIRLARKIRGGNRERMRLLLGDQTVGFEDGEIRHHPMSMAVPYDWRNLIPPHPTRAGCASLDPQQLTRLCQALGGGPVHLCIDAEHSEVLVLTKHTQDPHTPPVGIIMRLEEDS